MVQVMMEATTQTTMTALRGWPSTTLDTHDDHGKTPSRATAKTRRDAARMAMAVFYANVSRWTSIKVGSGSTYKPQSDNADYIHHNVAALAEDHGV